MIPQRVLDALIDCYNLDELRRLAFDLGLKFDDLQGEGFSAKATDLVSQAEARGRLREVEEAIAKKCPHLVPSPSPNNPYVGLRTFQESDATRFYGREQLVETLVKRVGAASFLTVLGPSGSGKSSVVLAGLLPALRVGKLPGSERWQYAILKPGNLPLNALAATLATIGMGTLGDVITIRQSLERDERALLLAAEMLRTRNPNARLVLVVDQFEELWTQAPTEAEARKAYAAQVQLPFVRLLLADGVLSPAAPLVVVLTLRADFLARAAEVPALARAIQDHLVIVSPMESDELRRAIERPAQQAGGTFEPGLVGELVEQAQGRAGALPLLQDILFELWQQCDLRGTLTWHAYEQLGGVDGALAARADALLAEYSDAQRAELRHLLLRLVQPGEGATDTRRRLPLSNLVPSDSAPDLVRALLHPLVAGRLLTMGRDPATGQEFVELTHEALIRAWPTLGAWLTEARQDLYLHRQLEGAAQDWEKHSEPPGLLWHDLTLARANEWLRRATPALNARETRFMEASQVHEQARLRRARFNLQLLVGLTAALSVLAVALVMLTLREREARGTAQQAAQLEGAARVEAQQAAQRAQAEGRRALALSQAGTALSDVTENNDETALLRALAAVSPLLDEGNLVSRALHQTLNQPLRRVLRSNKRGNEVAWSPDGQQVVWGHHDGTLSLWRVATGRPISLFMAHEGRVTTVAWSPGGQLIASGSTDGTVRLWEVATGQALYVLRGHEGEVEKVAWSPDGRQLASAGYDGTVRLWEVERGSQTRVLSHESWVGFVAWSPDGQQVATAGQNGVVRFWQVTTGEHIGTLLFHVDSVFALAWSPDGKRIGVADAAHSIHLWSLETNEERILASGLKQIAALAWSPDGKYLASAHWDSAVWVWDADSGKVAHRLVGNQGVIFSLAWSPDGRQLMSGGNTIRLWQVPPGDASRLLLAPSLWRTSSVVWSSDGAQVAAVGGNGIVWVWEAVTGRVTGTLQGYERSAYQIAWSPDSHLLATGDDAGKVRVWQVATDQLSYLLEGHTGVVGRVAWHPSGQLLASGGEDGDIRVWHLGQDEAVHVLGGHNALIYSVAWSPDGHLLASGDTNGIIRVWQGKTGQVIQVLTGHEGNVESLAWSLDGRYLLSAGADGIVWLWEVTSGQATRMLTGHEGGVSSVAWSPDGQQVVSGGKDGTVRVWDISGEGEEYVLTGHEGGVSSVAWSPDGRQVVSGGEDGTVRVWTIDLPLLIARLTERVCWLNLEDEQIRTVVPDWEGCEAELAGVAEALRVYHELQGE